MPEGSASHGAETLDRDAVISDLPQTFGGSPPPWYAVTTVHGWDGEWYYVEYEGGWRELYDVRGDCLQWQPGDQGDPCLMDNLAYDPSYEELQQRLSARLAELKRE